MEILTVNDSKQFKGADVDALIDAKSNVVQLRPGHYHLLHLNKGYSIEVVEQDIATKTLVLKVNGTLYKVSAKDRFDILLDKLGIISTSQQKHSVLKAPMPGLVLDIRVSVGQTVKKGDTLIVLEAMKMENSLKAPHDGTIQSIDVQTALAVEKGQTLLQFQ